MNLLGVKFVFKKLIESIAPEVDGLTKEEVQDLHLKNPLSRYILPVSYDPENGFFFCEDDTVLLLCELSPTLGIGESALNILISGIFKSHNLPPNSLIQFTLWGSPYIEPQLESYVSMRPDDKKWLPETFAEFYRQHTSSYLFPEWQVPVRDFRLFFSLKIPCSIEKYKKREKDFFYLKESILSTLKSAGLHPLLLNAEDLIKLYYLIFNPGHDLTHEKALFYNPDIEIRKHCVKGDTVLEQEFDYIRLDGFYGKALTVDVYPKEIEITKTRELIGSFMGEDSTQISTPFFFTLALRKGTDAEKGAIHAKDAATPKIPDNSAFSGLFTKQRERAEEFFYAANRITQDGVIWKGCVIWFLYHPDFEHLTRAINTLKNFALSAGFTLQEEIANLPLFLACVPGNLVAPVLDGEIKEGGKKKKTFSFGRAATYFVHNCAHLLPVHADWKGTPTPVSPFIGRMGQLAFIDLWDTESE